MEFSEGRLSNPRNPSESIASTLLADIYLDLLDLTAVKAGFLWVPYADDFVILCNVKLQTEFCLVCIN